MPKLNQRGRKVEIINNADRIVAVFDEGDDNFDGTDAAFPGDVAVEGNLVVGGSISGALGGSNERVASYVIYKSGSTFQADSPIGLAAVAANADAAAVLQSCMDNINSSTTPRGTIVFAPNTDYTWSSVPTIRRTYASGGSDDKKWLRILGSGGSKILCQTGGECFIRVNRQADYDGFCGIEIGHLLIDANSKTSPNSHVVFGNRTSGSNVIQRCDYRRIYLHDIETINVPSSITNAYFRPNIWMQISHVTVSEGTQNVCEDITLERCRFNGGFCGYNIGHIHTGGGSPLGLNIKNDRIVVRDTYWDSGLAGQYLAFQTGGCQIGGNAFGGSILFEDCTFIGSGDIGIEIDNFKHSTVRRCVARDCNTTGFFYDNFNYVNGVDASEQQEQTILWEDCVHEATIDLTAISGQRNGFFQAGGGAGTVDWGTIIFRGCRYVPKVPMTWMGGQWGRLPPSAGRSIQKVVFENCTWETYNNNASGSSLDPSIWLLEQCPKVLIIRDQKIVWRGTQSSSGGLIERGLQLLGGDKDKCWFLIDGFEILDLTSGRATGITEGIRLGNGIPAGSTTNDIRGIIRRLRFVNQPAANPNALVVGNNANLTLGRLDYQDSDFSNLTSLNSDLLFQTAGQNEAQVYCRGINPRVPPRGEITFTPGATTVSAQYLGHYEGLMTITGGTVTLVEVSTDNSTFRTVAAGTNVGFYIDHGWYVRITYTGTPTCKVIPRR